MIFSKLLFLLSVSILLATGAPLLAQEADEAEAPPVPADTPEAAPVKEEVFTYDDYNVKQYSLTFFGGQFSGAKYLENKALGPRTVLTDGAADILGFDGNVLLESTDTDRYTGAHKEIESGPAFGARIGIYISNDFHLDLLGSYSMAKAVTTMQFTEDPVAAPDKFERIEVDRDEDVRVLRGGLALMYDARPASIFGIVPRIGFGLGGVINTYSVLPDKTALYLEGNFALNYNILDNLALGGQVDVTNFAFQVDELGYSNMVNYFTYTVGVTWFIDVVPDDIRAAHLAESTE